MANSVITKVTGTDSSSNRIGSTFYGTCTTAAATASKAVTLSDSCVFTDSCLVTGVTIHVKFTNSNTHATPTLKVGTATAKQIMAYGTTKAGTTATASWYAGSVVSFTYDGTYWIMNDYKIDTDTNTWRDVKLNGTQILGTSTSTGSLNIVPGTYMNITNSSGSVTFEPKETQVTQAQYDALVQAGTVDADTTYFITDRNNAESAYAASVIYDNTISGLDSTNVQGAIDEIVTGGNYSTTQEQRVGTWVDGNPLYRIVMKISTSVTSWSVIGTIAIQEDHVAFADFYCKAPSSSGYTFSQSYYTGSHDMFRAALQWNNNDKNYKLYAQLGTSYPAKPAEVTAIIYYTKTTS